jgi:hypothetical protein
MGGIEAIMSTINAIGDITLRDIVTSVMSLTILVIKTVFQLISTLVLFVYGQSGMKEWVDSTNQLLLSKSIQLSSQANVFCTDLSHKSMNELLAAIESLIQCLVESSSSALFANVGVDAAILLGA